MLWLAASLAASFLTGCSDAKRMDSEEAQSDLRLTRSFGAETETFLDFVLRGQSTAHFAEEHARLLENEMDELLKDMQRSVPEPDAESSVRECRGKLKALRNEVSRIHQAIVAGDRDTLAGAQSTIRREFEKTSQQP